MSDEQWEELQEKFYTKQPITKEREEWDRLFSKAALEKQERQKEEKKKEEKARKKRARMKIRAQQRREDKSQTKLTTFFAKKTNEDGYPLKHCKYHPDFKRHIYVPPGYERIPQSTSANDPSEKKGIVWRVLLPLHAFSVRCRALLRRGLGPVIEHLQRIQEDTAQLCHSGTVDSIPPEEA